MGVYRAGSLWLPTFLSTLVQREMFTLFRTFRGEFTHCPAYQTRV